ncbi:MAG TPA: hypothetical protein ENN61_02500 [Bacteroidaceae bacterium]|nr:hypothetical protein [Bacteroidaceae bacterium]
MKRILFSGAILFLALNGISNDSPLWLRYPSISPDGNTILFNYKGDIYKVPATGGTAIPLTVSESYEYSAVWSHDGRQIAFASNRYGNFDVYVMPASGGEAERLTFHSTDEIPQTFSADNRFVLFSACRQDVVTNVQYPTGIMSELYRVSVTGGRVSQVISTPAFDVQINSAGNKLIFHDIKGFEDNWRKHHTSSVTRDPMPISFPWPIRPRTEGRPLACRFPEQVRLCGGRDRSILHWYLVFPWEDGAI